MDNQKRKILFLLGVLACVCRWDPAVCPKAIPLFLCFIPIGYSIHRIVRRCKIVANIAVAWYSVFFLFVAFSLSYTPNNYDAMDVVRRCAICLVFILCVSQLLKDQIDLFWAFSGLILGSLLTLLIAVLFEWSMVGLGRLGVITCGAATTFSCILLIGFTCSMYLFFFFSKRSALVSASILVLGIVLSGSRMPIILVFPIYLCFSLSQSTNIVKSVKKILLVSVAVCIALWAVMNHPVLYKLAGNRIDTMIESFQYRTDMKTDSSLEGRKLLKENAIAIWEKHPIAGGGVNCFWVLSSFTVGRATSHCGFTEILCSFGLIGFVLFYWPFSKMLTCIYKGKLKIVKLSSIVLLIFLLMDWQAVAFLSTANTFFYALLFSNALTKNYRIDRLN